MIEREVDGLRSGFARAKSRYPRLFRSLPWSIPLAYAIAFGAAELIKRREQPLDPDAITYLQLASNYDFATWVGGFREPIWHSLLAIPVNVIGEQPTIIRLQGLAGFAILVFVAVVLTRQLTSSSGLAFAAGMAIAASPWLLYQAPRGLREEAAAAGILALLAFSMRSSVHRWFPLFGVAVGVLALLRWDSLMVTLPLLLTTAILRRREVGLRRTVVAVALAAAVVSPFVVGNAVRFHDPLYHSNVAALFFRNIEFAGQPGYASQEAVARDAFVGPPETWGRYLFERHGTREILERTVRGAARNVQYIPSLAIYWPHQPDFRVPWPRLWLFSFPEMFATSLLALGGISGAILLASRGSWQLLIVTIFAVVQHAPIAALMDPRLGLSIYPVLIVGFFVALGGVFARRGSNLREDS